MAILIITAEINDDFKLSDEIKLREYLDKRNIELIDVQQINDEANITVNYNGKIEVG